MATTEIEPTPLPKIIAEELTLEFRQVTAALEMLDEGSTVPFIARYRKEKTGGLDEVAIRNIGERAEALRELADRRETVLRTIEEQGKLTDELRAKIMACGTKVELEDLYLPYKPKRRTKAMIAREKGLEPLALRILEQPTEGDPRTEAEAFVDEEKGVATVEAALDGARDIVIETVTENADARALIRENLATRGNLTVKAATDQEDKRTRFEDYYDYAESVAAIPSHRYLAIRRGENEGVLRAKMALELEPLQERLERMMGLDERSPFAEELRSGIDRALRARLMVSAETDVRVELKMRSDKAAVEIFAENLEHLLMAPPFGSRAVVGIDPGMRTGCKCAAVDATGRLLDHVTIYPFRGEDSKERARQELRAFLVKHKPEAVAVGNGTAGRETEALARETIRESSELAQIIVVSVSESGASVYSASEIAREEFPDLDLTIRGAISIARRLQDPLSELVKVEPKSIGVGQYQHDVMQTLLERKLGEVVESCVNRVGVEVNTASASLLSYVAGLGRRIASNIVAHRNTEGPFVSRKALLKVRGLGPKTFEQAAGFLRVRESQNPLDRSAVHPERYGLVERIASDMNVTLDTMVGDGSTADRIDINRYVGDGVGEPTLRDIVAELKRPGRDPRDTFEAPSFREDVQTMEDLTEGMILEGVVTNVTAFGAFVDIGVHQDGLVHISQLADHFIKDPKDVVKVGQPLKVRVIGVDLERKRISLSSRSAEPPKRRDNRSSAKNDDGRRSGNKKGRGRDDRRASKAQGKFTNNPFADLLRK